MDSSNRTPNSKQSSSESEHSVDAVEMVQSLLNHPRVGKTAAQAMLSELMGHSRATPFMLASSLGNLPVVNVLKEMLLGGEYELRSSEGQTVLHIAAKQRKPSLMSSLVTVEQSDSPAEEGKKLVGSLLRVLRFLLAMRL